MAGWVAGAVVGSALIGAATSSSAASKQASAATQAAQMQSDAATKSAQIQSDAATKAAQIQSDSAAAATQAQKDALAQQIALNKPFYDVGVGAVNRLASQQPYTPEAFNYQADPGYAFRFNEGMKGLNATAAARGGLISGNALRAATDYGQASGSQEYQNAYNRYLTNNAQNLQAYNTNTGLQQNLAGIGQASANNQATAFGNYGNTAGANLIGAANANAAGITGAANAGAAGMTGAANAGAAGMTGAANAGAAGMVGSANALTNGLGTGINYYQNQNMLNAFNNINRSSYAGTNQAINQYGANNVYGPGGAGSYNLSPAMFDVQGGV